MSSKIDDFLQGHYAPLYKDIKAIELRTPSNVARDMIDLLPDDVWTAETKFADIYCKSGIFIECIIDKLLSNADYSFLNTDNKNEIIDYIMTHQIYALCWDETENKKITQLVKTLYRVRYNHDNIRSIQDINKLDNPQITYKYLSSITKDVILYFWKELFQEMKIDVVVGNPPYKSDKYIDFVEFGHSLASKCSLFITPTKGIDKYTFSDNISNVCYYPYSGEIWNQGINVKSICYYRADNSPVNSCNLKTVRGCKTTIASVENLKCLDADSLSIINKLDLNRTFAESIKTSVFGRLDTDRYLDIVSEVQEAYPLKLVKNRKTMGYLSYSSIKEDSIQYVDKYKLVCSQRQSDTLVTSIVNPNEVFDKTVVMLYCSDDLDTIKYVDSYLKTRLIQYLTGIDSRGTTKDLDYWRLVPLPSNFDHIFTDAELYTKYNLTENEITIIKSTVKR